MQKSGYAADGDDISKRRGASSKVVETRTKNGPKIVRFSSKTDKNNCDFRPKTGKNRLIFVALDKWHYDNCSPNSVSHRYVNKECLKSQYKMVEDCIL